MHTGANSDQIHLAQLLRNSYFADTIQLQNTNIFMPDLRSIVHSILPNEDTFINLHNTAEYDPHATLYLKAIIAYLKSLPQPHGSFLHDRIIETSSRRSITRNDRHEIIDLTQPQTKIELIHNFQTQLDSIIQRHALAQNNFENILDDKIWNFIRQNVENFKKKQKKDIGLPTLCGYVLTHNQTLSGLIYKPIFAKSINDTIYFLTQAFDYDKSLQKLPHEEKIVQINHDFDLAIEGTPRDTLTSFIIIGFAKSENSKYPIYLDNNISWKWLDNVPRDIAMRPDDNILCLYGYFTNGVPILKKQSHNGTDTNTYYLTYLDRFLDPTNTNKFILDKIPPTALVNQTGVRFNYLPIIEVANVSKATENRLKTDMDIISEPPPSFIGYNEEIHTHIQQPAPEGPTAELQAKIDLANELLHFDEKQRKNLFHLKAQLAFWQESNYNQRTAIIELIANIGELNATFERDDLLKQATDLSEQLNKDIEQIRNFHIPTNYEAYAEFYNHNQTYVTDTNTKLQRLQKRFQDFTSHST